MSDCTHDCSTCGEACASREQESLKKPLREGASVKKVIAVVSGKGGVGKSLVTSLLASEMQRRGHNCAVLDADITGPSIPTAFGLTEPHHGSDATHMETRAVRETRDGDAQSVVNYLGTQGVKLSRMKAKGFGAEMPIADNKTESGREQNRRIEMLRAD